MAMVDDFDVQAYRGISSTSSHGAPPLSLRPSISLDDLPSMWFMTLTAHDVHTDIYFYQTSKEHQKVIQDLFFLHRPLISSDSYADLYTVPKHDPHYFTLLQTFRGC